MGELNKPQHDISGESRKLLKHLVNRTGQFIAFNHEVRRNPCAVDQRYA